MRRSTPSSRASFTRARLPSTFTSLESSGSRAQAGIADDGRQVHHGLGALEGAPAGVGVADVAADQLDAAVGEVLGHVLLAVQQHVQHPDLAARGEQLVHDERADIAGSTGNRDRHRATGWTGAWPAAGWLDRCEPGGSLAVFSFIRRGLTCSNSRIAFS